MAFALPREMMVVVDADMDPATVLGRLRPLAPGAVVFDPDGRTAGASALRRMADVLAKAAAEGARAVVWVQASQTFLDPAIMARGIAAMAERDVDYFTQWEHCLLPVGIGVRAFSLDLLRRSGAATFAAALAYVFANRERTTVFHDDEAYIDHERMRLDARHSAALQAAIDAKGGDVAFGLDGFLALAGDDEAWIYTPPAGELPAVDERGMAAAYGFESTACARFPTYVMFDLTNKCNAACIHCPQSVGFPGMETTSHMRQATFRGTIDQLVGRELDFIRVTADGEPLIHPGIWDFLNYARDKKVGPVGLTTNGSALNARNIEKLLDAEIFMVDISLDAFSAKTFEHVRAGLSYERTRDNVLRLIEARNARGSAMKIMVSFVLQKENEHELEDFKAFWDPRVDKTLIREMHTNVGVNDNGSDADPNADRWPCAHFFRRITIDYDGAIKFCPIDWQGASRLGPLAKTTLYDAWHGSSYRHHRMQHLNNEIETASICKTCTDWRGTPWDRGYEKVIKSLQALDS